MTRFSAFLAATALALGFAAPAFAAETSLFAQDRNDQGEARKEMRAGNILHSRDIEARVLPKMREHEYLGFAYDATMRAYRLKFIKDGRVTYIDVDARTGRVISRSR